MSSVSKSRLLSGPLRRRPPTPVSLLTWTTRAQHASNTTAYSTVPSSVHTRSQRSHSRACAAHVISCSHPQLPLERFRGSVGGGAAASASATARPAPEPKGKLNAVAGERPSDRSRTRTPIRGSRHRAAAYSRLGRLLGLAGLVWSTGSDVVF